MNPAAVGSVAATKQLDALSDVYDVKFNTFSFSGGRQRAATHGFHELWYSLSVCSRPARLRLICPQAVAPTRTS